MFLNQFSVRVVAASGFPAAREQHSGYVEIEHGTQYSIALGNHAEVECDARVEVDGKDCGTFRVHSGGSIILERPQNDTGRFTAHVVDSAEGQQGGLRVGDNMNGLIQVTFMPEKPRSYAENVVAVAGSGTPDFLRGASRRVQYQDWAHPSGPQKVNSSRVREVGTTLTGESGQRFQTVNALNYDTERFTTISLRLVAPDRHGLSHVRPLVSRSNPVPPPVRPLR